MKFQWSLLLLAISVIIVTVGAVGYVKSQLVHVDTNTRPHVVTSLLPNVVSLGRLEPQGQVIHVAAPARSGQSRLASLLVKESEHVKKGQILAILDGKCEHEAARVQADKQLTVAEAELQKIQAPPKKSDLTAQQSVVLRLEAELGNATRERDRYSSLYKEGAVSASVLDTKNLAVDIAQQQLDQSKANLSGISEVRPVEVAVASAHVESAKAEVQFAKTQLDLDYIRAPIDGQIIKVHTHAGETAVDGGILELANTNSMYVVAEVYESDASRVRVGQSAIIQCDALPGTMINGAVEEIGLQIEKKKTLDPDASADVDSRIVEERIKIDARDCRRVARYTNSHVKVTILTEQKKNDFARLASAH